jgi:hypothetical protein
MADVEATPPPNNIIFKFPPQKGASCKPWIGRWVGPQGGLEIAENKTPLLSPVILCH